MNGLRGINFDVVLTCPIGAGSFDNEANICPQRGFPFSLIKDWLLSSYQFIFLPFRS